MWRCETTRFIPAWRASKPLFHPGSGYIPASKNADAHTPKMYNCHVKRCTAPVSCHPPPPHTLSLSHTVHTPSPIQVRDSLKMYNNLVERCFKECAEDMRSKALSSGEEKVCLCVCGEGGVIQCILRYPPLI